MIIIVDAATLLLFLPSSNESNYIDVDASITMILTLLELEWPLLLL